VLAAGREKPAHEDAVAGAPGLLAPFDGFFLHVLDELVRHGVFHPLVQVANEIVNARIALAELVVAGLVEVTRGRQELGVVEVLVVLPRLPVLTEELAQEMFLAAAARVRLLLRAVGIGGVA
jgi:hypothetical protein